MAKAQFKTETTVKRIEVEEQFVQLTLTEDEATTLAALLAAVGGSPGVSRRAHADSMSAALRSCGFHWQDIRRDVPGCTRDKMVGSISFNLTEFDE